MHFSRSIASMLMLAGLGGLTSVCSPAMAGEARLERQADLAALRQLVQQFQSAIISHDGKALAGLFLPEQNAWLSVLDDPSYAAARERKPDARKLMLSTSQKFIDFVAGSDKAIEERFTDVRIETNGTVASVYFDFDFLVAGAVNNRGSESWQLVKSEDGWKICAMLYSVGR